MALVFFFAVSCAPAAGTMADTCSPTAPAAVLMTSRRPSSYCHNDARQNDDDGTSGDGQPRPFDWPISRL